jgi:hypothetical protein
MAQLSESWEDVGGQGWVKKGMKKVLVFEI